MYEKFSHHKGIQFEGHGELIACNITNDNCQAQIFPHGAHITKFQPTGQPSMLFLSNQAVFLNGRAIRGGVPVCFPWFGNHNQDSNAPAHGWVRQKKWNLINIISCDEQTLVKFATQTDHFAVLLTAIFGKDLKMMLQVTNTSTQTESFESALHSYFQISDISKTQIDGLQSAKFLDQLTSQWHQPDNNPIRFTQEIDRIYQFKTDQPAADSITLSNTQDNNKIVIDRINARSIVVWNPWIEKAKRLSDLGDQQWTEMCCVECGNIGENQVRLAPGTMHKMTVTHGFN